MPSKITVENFISRAKTTHGERYDYSKISFTAMVVRVEIGCSTHGFFWQTPISHVRGAGCPECGSERTRLARLRSKDDFIAAAKDVHGDKYDYTNVSYALSTTPVVIGCLVHGAFTQAPRDHLRGNGCRKCGVARRTKLNTHSCERFIEKARQVHGDAYAYAKSVYTLNSKPVLISCRIHGDFMQVPRDHLSGYGCPACGRLKVESAVRFTKKDFIAKAIEKHGTSYDYSEVEYTVAHAPVLITCAKGHRYSQAAYLHLYGHGCQKCSTFGPSNAELALADFLAAYTCVIRSDRTVLAPSELDCFLPDKNIGVEFNGLYFHSSKFRTKSYHLDKLTKMTALGLGLVQVFEDEWSFKKDIVKSVLLSRIGASPIKVFARNLRVGRVTPKEYRKFIERNHLQGFAAAEIVLGLYSQESLVMLTAFSTKRAIFGKQEANWFELVRMCSALNTSVVGGFSRLLAHFIKAYKPEGVKTFCDRRYFNGAGYEAVGFIHSHNTTPNYWYFKQNARYSRFSFQKHKLATKLAVFDAHLSEKANMEANGYYRIYDCGNAVYTLKVASFRQS